MKVENNVTECQVLEYHPQCKQKSRTIYVNNKLKLCKYFVYNKKSTVFFCLWLNTLYVLDNPCFSIIPHLLPTTTPDNQQYTVFCCKSELFSSYAKRVRYIFMIVVRHHITISKNS